MMIEKKTDEKKLSYKLWLKNIHLKNLANNGHIIGMHAYTHPYKLSQLSYKKQLNELKKNFMHLKSILKKKPISISYPNGSFNKDTIKIISNFGIKCGFLSNMKSYNSLYPENYVLKRLDHTIIIKNLLNK
jgi:peptidoglycan/xylan/chitin deacetylase (PgdA/CDA1 family)